ncbi:MAG TPA: arsenite methyltransferase [Blastocatellia bacterium]|nr:arsenite methyltransferase [Blastocatellia bacterium]
MSKQIEQAVRDRYGSFARSRLSTDNDSVRTVAEAFGYSAEELSSIPAEANMGLSCGNPTAYANLRRGEVVVDLGCGGGLDTFLASPKVGPEGRAIGIDMTPAMIERARRNAEKSGVTNVEFHLSTIDKLPLESASVDCVISNCVINLAPDKQAVFREIIRVLKPGGRLAVSDIALKNELPAEVSNDLLAYVGCVAGAILIDDYKRSLLEAGFEHVEIVDTKQDLNIYDKLDNQETSRTSSASPPVANSSCCSSVKDSGHDHLSDLLTRYNVNDYAASVRVYALKSSNLP